MKKVLSILCLLLFLFPYSASAEQEYYTIHEIQEQAREMLKAAELTGTIQIETTKGIFDVSIEIPEVDRVPIVQVTLPSSNQVPSVPENGKVTEHMVDYHSTSYLTGWVVDVNRDELYGEYVKNTIVSASMGWTHMRTGAHLRWKKALLSLSRSCIHIKNCADGSSRCSGLMPIHAAIKLQLAEMDS